MDLGEMGIEGELEFWPLEHPTEPPDEDKPLKCPISDTLLVNDPRRQEERFTDRSAKKSEYSAMVQKQDTEGMGAEPTIGVVRKRHHTLTTTNYGDNTKVTPIWKMTPIYPNFVPMNMSISDMILQQFNKFDS